MTTQHTPRRSAWLGLAALALPCMITVIDMTVLNLAVPRLSAALQPTGTQLLWVIDIYGFMLAGALIPIGSLGDRIGRRKLLLIGAAAFGVSSALAAFSTSATMLIVTRGLLGLAGAALVPSTLSMVSTLFQDPGERNKAIGVWGASFAVGALVGPVMGGALLEHFWWGAVFLPGVPVMALLLLVGPRLLPEYRDPNAAKPDLPSAVLSLGSILTAVYGMKQLVQDGPNLVALAAIGAGLALGATFVQRQRCLADPMVDLNLFRDAAFTTAVGCNVLNVFLSFGSFVLISQYLQLVLGLSPLQAGLLSLPASAMAMVGPMLSPVMSQRFGAASSVGAMLAIAGVGFGVLTFVGGPFAAATVAIGWAFWALGGAAAATLTTGTILGAARPERAGAVSALAQTGAELGGALGIAVLGSVGTAIYRVSVASALPADISPDLAAIARDTLAGALSVAAQVPEAASLAVTAQDALVLALRVVCAVGALISIASAVAAARYLQPRAAQRVECSRCDPFPAAAA